MLPLTDTQIRLVLLNHVVVKLSKGDVAAVERAGIDRELLAHLRAISAHDLHRLAEMRDLMIAVAFKSDGLKASLRCTSLVDEAKAVEAYFIRHGATWQMLGALFKMGRKAMLKRRREAGVWRGRGRLPLPDMKTRKRIFCAWLAMKESDPRTRYFRLHQRFSEFSIAALAAVVRQFEERE